MSHVRQQIREAIVAALTGLPTTGARVTTGDPYAVGTTPALVIVAAEERVDTDSIGSVKQTRQAEITVIGYADGQSVEDDLDTISAEVEGRLDGSQLGGLAKEVFFTGMTKIIAADGTKRSGEIRMMFSVFYRVQRGAPGTALA